MKAASVIVALLVAFVGALALAHAAGFDTQVGGLSIVVSATGAVASTSLTASDNVTWDTPAKFTPDYVMCISDINAQGDLSATNEWFVGMASNTAIHMNSSAGVVSYHSNGSTECGIDTATPGTITLTYGCLDPESTWSCWAARYSK